MDKTPFTGVGIQLQQEIDVYSSDAAEERRLLVRAEDRAKELEERLSVAEKKQKEIGEEVTECQKELTAEQAEIAHHKLMKEHTAQELRLQKSQLETLKRRIRELEEERTMYFTDELTNFMASTVMT